MRTLFFILDFWNRSRALKLGHFIEILRCHPGFFRGYFVKNFRRLPNGLTMEPNIEALQRGFFY